MEKLRGSRWIGVVLCALLVSSRAAGAGSESLLGAALVAAGKVSVPRMLAEKNLTWKSDQLQDLARLYSRAGRFNEALKLVRDLDEPERIKSGALGQIAVSALEAGNRQLADDLIKELSASEEWAAPAALASIARALHKAGRRDEALLLAGRVQDPLEQGGLYLEIGGPAGLRHALVSGSRIEPGAVHVPRGNTLAWMHEFSSRQSFLLRVLSAAVDAGEPELAREALQALGQVPDPSLFQWRTRALIEIARGERSAGKPDAATLQQALTEIEAGFPENLGDLYAKVELMATLAGRSGEDAAVAVLKRAADVARGIESVPDPGIRDDFHVAMLARLARAWADLGRKTEALELLARAAQIADAMALDRASPDHYRRIEARARVAAGFEHAGEHERGAPVLARSVKDISATRSEDRRSSAWLSLVEAYEAAGKLDRALGILGSESAPADRFLAVQELAGRLPSSGLLRLAPLVDGLPASYGKIDLSARIAAELERAGQTGEAALLTTAALDALKSKPENWDLALIRLANGAQDPARPADAEQRKVLKAILKGL